METSRELTHSPALFPAVLTTSNGEDAGEAEKFMPLLFYISQREWWVLGTGEKGDPLQIIWRWCLQGTRMQTEGLSWR